MGKKNKQKWNTPPSPSGGPPAPTGAAPSQAAPPPPPSEEQNRSLVGRIAESVASALGRATPEQKEAAVPTEPAPEPIDLKAAWMQAEQGRKLYEQQAKAASEEEKRHEAARRKHEEEQKKLAEEREALELRTLELEDRDKQLKQTAKDQEVSARARQGELDAREKALLAREKGLLEREEKLRAREAEAEAGFVAQHAAALAKLTEQRERLEAELRSLLLRNEKQQQAWIQEAEAARQSIAEEGRQARKKLDQELASVREEEARELARLREEARRQLEGERARLAEEQRQIEEVRRKLRQEEIGLRAERELLEDDRRDLDRRVELKAAARVEKLQADLRATQEVLEEARRDRDRLQEALGDRQRADRLLGQRTPEEAAAWIRLLEEKNAELGRKLAARPTEEDSERLRYLEQERDAREQELARLRRENADAQARLGTYSLNVAAMESLRSRKEAAETYNRLLEETVHQYEEKVNGLIQKSKSKTAFRACTGMDQDPELQAPVERLERLPSLKDFCDDLRQRIARNPKSAQPLYYSPRDVRAFVAGLAMSKLHLLQGISGTGKTSLPRELARAVGGDFTLIEVQASWRDRDDLLGHFNAFEGEYREEKVLQALYRAQTPAYRDRLCVVVLDEMNLSSPEHYFADLLAQLEQPENERALKLMASAVPNPPSLFVNGHTLRIPPNVWFIGTANHDETTRSFADKTYDRAHVMELPRHREPFTPVVRDEQRPPVSYTALLAAFAEAQRVHAKEAEQAYRALDAGLAKPLEEGFQIGWGNRLERQMAAYVPVVRASGGSLIEAVDHLLATKVLRRIRDRHETRIGDLDLLSEALEKTAKSLGSEKPDRSVKVIDDERKRLKLTASEEAA